MGIIFALLTTLSWSIGIFPFTEASRRLGLNSLNHFRLLLATVLLFIMCLLTNATLFFHLFSINYLNAWLWFGLSGIIGLAIGDYFFFGLYAIMGARIGSIFTTLSPAAALLTSRLFIDERINSIGIIGIGITIVGVLIINLNKKDESHLVLTHGSKLKGILYGILAAFCQGIGLVLAKKGFMSMKEEVLEMNPVHATFIRMFISILLLSVVTILSGNINKVLFPLLINKKGGIKHAIAGTFFGPVIGVCLSLYTITLIEATVAQTIFSLVPMAAVFIAFLIYNEKLSVASVLSALISVLGVIILIWRNELKELLIKYI